MAALTVFRTALLAVAVAGSVDGSLAATDGSDTLSSSGSPIVVGSLAVTDDADTLSATGGQSPIGSLAVTDDTDTLVATGSPVVVGSLAVTDGTDTLAAADVTSFGPRQPFTWREWHNSVTHKEGGPTVGRLIYSAHAEDPGPGIWWLSRAGTLIDFSSGYTWSAKITDGTTTLLTKTTGITGAAGAGTNPTGTPNVTIDWSTGELNIAPGEYTLELTPTYNSRQRQPLKVPIRIEASAP